MSDWQKVTCSQSERPSELDTTSSAVYVYQRRNIERVTVDDETSGSYQMWEYEERKLTKDEYAALLEEELTQTQLALIEIYERSMM